VCRFLIRRSIVTALRHTLRTVNKVISILRIMDLGKEIILELGIILSSSSDTIKSSSTIEILRESRVHVQGFRNVLGLEMLLPSLFETITKLEVGTQLLEGISLKKLSVVENSLDSITEGLRSSILKILNLITRRSRRVLDERIHEGLVVCTTSEGNLTVRLLILQALHPSTDKVPHVTTTVHLQRGILVTDATKEVESETTSAETHTTLLRKKENLSLLPCTLVGIVRGTVLVEGSEEDVTASTKKSATNGKLMVRSLTTTVSEDTVAVTQNDESTVLTLTTSSASTTHSAGMKNIVVVEELEILAPEFSTSLLSRQRIFTHGTTSGLLRSSRNLIRSTLLINLIELTLKVVEHLLIIREGSSIANTIEFLRHSINSLDSLSEGRARSDNTRIFKRDVHLDNGVGTVREEIVIGLLKDLL